MPSVVPFGVSSFLEFVRLIMPVAVHMSLFHDPLSVFVIPSLVASAIIVISEGMSQSAVVSPVPVVAVVEIEVVVKSQVAVVVVNAPSAQADESCPGNPYKVGSADVAAEDICRNHKGPVPH